MRTFLIRRATVLVSLLLIVHSSAASTLKPRLVVVIVVDQMRADYLDRFSDLFCEPMDPDGKPGGLRFLAERGARFTNAKYRHFPLFTGPGHAVILTGGYPYKTGILANDWYSKEKGGSHLLRGRPERFRSGGGGTDLKRCPCRRVTFFRPH